MSVSVLDKGKVSGKKYLREHYCGQITIGAYLSKGCKYAFERYTHKVKRDRFLLGWWYVGYPYFGIMEYEPASVQRSRRACLKNMVVAE